MDFKKKLIISGTVLGVLVVLFIVGQIAAALRNAPTGEVLFPAFKPDLVASIAITDKNGAIELRKAGDDWQILSGGRSFDLDESRVEAILTGVADLRKNQVASSRPETWGDFSVDEAQAVRLVLRKADGTALVDCFLGKAGTTSFSQYLRLAGENEVIQANSRFDYTTNLKDWVQLGLFPDLLQTDSVAAISIASNISFLDTETGIEAAERPVSVSLVNTGEVKEEKPVWQARGNEGLPVSADKVTSFISAFANFTAEDVVVDPAAANIDETAVPLGAITLTLADKTTWTLVLVAGVEGDKTRFYVKRGDGRYYYIATDWSLRSLFTGLESFIEALVLNLE